MEQIDRWVLEYLADGDLAEVIFIWAFAIFMPAVVAPILVKHGFGELKSSIRGEGKPNAGDLLFIVVGLVVFVLGLVPLISLVRNMEVAIALTIASAGGFVLAVVFCLIALPIGWIGYELRTFTFYLFKGYKGPGRAKPLIRFSIGLVVLLALAIALYHFVDPQKALAFCAVAGGIMLLGFFGSFLVPIDV